MVVFTYDDGPREDYTETFPVHKAHDAPACVAVCPGFVGDSEDYMETAHIRELSASGWEILSHTLRHRALGEIPLERDAAEGDDRLYVQTHRHGQYNGDPLAVFDDHQEVTATSAGRGTDSGDHYLELEMGLETSINAETGFVRYTEAFTRELLEESKARIEEWGIPVTGFVYPYGRSNGLVAELVPEYYGAVPNHRTGRGGLNPIENLEPTRMIRRYIETDKSTPEDIDQFMADVAERDVVGVVGGHSQYETLPAERVNLALELADDHGLQVVTFQEALSELDLLELPDPPEIDEGKTDGESPDTGENDTESDGDERRTENNGNESGTEDDGGATANGGNGEDDGPTSVGVAIGAAGAVGTVLAARHLASSRASDH